MHLDIPWRPHHCVLYHGMTECHMDMFSWDAHSDASAASSCTLWPGCVAWDWEPSVPPWFPQSPGSYQVPAGRGDVSWQSRHWMTWWADALIKFMVFVYFLCTDESTQQPVSHASWEDWQNKRGCVLYTLSLQRSDRAMWETPNQDEQDLWAETTHPTTQPPAPDISGTMWR